MVVPMIADCRWVERLIRSCVEDKHLVLESCPFCGNVHFDFFATDGEDIIVDDVVLEDYLQCSVNDKDTSALIETVPIDHLRELFCDSFFLLCDCGARMRGDDELDLILRWNRREPNEQ